MSLDVGKLLSGIGGAIGGIQGAAVQPYTQALGQTLQIGGAIASAFAPQPVAQPVYQVPALRTGLEASSLPAMAAGNVVLGGATSVVSGAIAAARAILPKIAAALGRKGITLSGAVSLARKLGKFFVSPEAIALYMGITVTELAQLITASSARKRRRMNPANSHALRRAARRIKSFHRLCQHTDLIKTRHSRRGYGARCTTCRKSPCRC
jgi:hypothetical protein